MSRQSPDREYVSCARGCDRRSFLLTVLAGSLCAALPVSGAGIASAGFSANDKPAWLSGTTGEHDAVVRLGRVYLAAHPGEQDAGFLLTAIERASAVSSGSATLDRLDPQQVVEVLRHVVRSEYIRGDVVPVDRWVLSTTEARLYALVASQSG